MDRGFNKIYQVLKNSKRERERERERVKERERTQKRNNKNEIEEIATRSYKGRRINILI